MLDKFKSLFHKGTLPPHPAHLTASEALSTSLSNQVAKCPFSKQNLKQKSETSMKCPVTGKAVEQPEVDSDSEEEKPKGGCPFMNGTSNKKKNPDLKMNESGYDEPLVSKFRFYLSTSKLDFSNIKRGLPQPTINRQIFDKYPIYLQHTLFFNGEDYKKVRSLECCSRFMAYEQLRQKGNKRYNKGKYYEALDFYERALSLYKWLEYSEPQSESTDLSSEKISSEEEMSENGSKVNVPLEDDDKNDHTDSFEELREKYKEFFITYTDDNTHLYDGDQMTEDADIDMRKSLMIQVYLNMCSAYIQTHHYYLALKVCDQGLALSDKVSQLYFRKAQALALNKDATIEQLQLAKQCIEIAIERRSGEKIFATANQNILKMLNIHDSEEAYGQCLKIVDEKLSEMQKNSEQTYNKVYERVKQINLNQKRIIEEGKVPQEGNYSKLMEKGTQMKILNRMSAKYIKVIEFYTEAKNQEQVKLAKNEFQQILRINSEVRDIFAVELQEKEDELGGILSEKVQNRVKFVKTQIAEKVYNAGKFNFTMLEWAIKQIVKQQKAEQEAKKKQEQQAVREALGISEEKEKKSGVNKYLYILLFIPILVMILNMFVL